MAGPITIVVADDDADDRLLIGDALEESELNNLVSFVEDGEELMEYLHRTGPYENLKGKPYPGLILLDLNMPRKGGAEALEEIRRDQDLRYIPVVILTTATLGETVERLYGLGANSFMIKPSSFEALCDAVKVLSQYWGNVVAVSPKCQPEGD